MLTTSNLTKNQGVFSVCLLPESTIACLRRGENLVRKQKDPSPVLRMQIKKILFRRAGLFKAGVLHIGMPRIHSKLPQLTTWAKPEVADIDDLNK